jgi:carboxyl-terminal processing protease
MPEKAYRTSSTSYRFDLPLVVLVNGDTASAAELLTAALQEHDRAVIAGEPTYGKGVVQSVTPLSENTGLALTTGQYFTSCGRSIQRPLPGTALGISLAQLESGATDAMKSSDPARRSSVAFRTDDGRPVSAGGGIMPDVTIPPRAMDPWLTFLNQTGVFTNFASEHLTLHGKVDDSFEPSSAVVESFRDFLVRNQIRVPEEYWSQDTDFVKLHIKTELFNLVFGLARGNEIEVKGDPQVQQAVSLLIQVPLLLKGAAVSPAATHK